MGTADNCRRRDARTARFGQLSFLRTANPCQRDLKPDDPSCVSGSAPVSVTRPLRSMAMVDDPVRAGVTLSAPAEHAFSIFVDRITDWWPKAYTFSRDDLAQIAIEPRPGGRWYEIDRRGQRLEWGDVRAFEPNRRLVLSWAISAERSQERPERASEVEVRFRPLGPRTTRVDVEHRAFARHGAGGEVMRQGMASREGWPYILREYAEAASPTARAVLRA